MNTQKVPHVLTLDPQLAGCSGDMFLSAFSSVFKLDASFLDPVIEAINSTFPGSDLELSFEEKHSFKTLHGLQSIITITNDKQLHHGRDVLDAFKQTIATLSLSEKWSNKALEALNLLLEAEAAVHHAKDSSSVHLHETGSLDTVLDIIGTMFILDRLTDDNLTIYGLPTAVGSGTIKISHGVVPLPAPAVAQLLKRFNYPFLKGLPQGEAITPTGAVLLMALTEGKIVPHDLVMTIDSEGYGFGSREFDEVANAFHITMGSVPSTSDHHLTLELETHIDDATGEELGFLMDELLNLGAFDAVYYPILMKKGRPAWSLRVIAPPHLKKKLLEFLFKESSTLGVREQLISRSCLRRKIITEKIPFGTQSFEINVKWRYMEDRVVGYKPERDEVITLAKQFGCSAKKIELAIHHELGHKIE